MVADYHFGRLQEVLERLENLDRLERLGNLERLEKLEKLERLENLERLETLELALEYVDLTSHLTDAEDVDAAGHAERDGLLGSVDAVRGNLDAGNVEDLKGFALGAVDMYLATLGLDGNVFRIDFLDLGSGSFQHPGVVRGHKSGLCCTGRCGDEQKSCCEYVAIE